MHIGVIVPNNWGIADPRPVLALGPLAEALCDDPREVAMGAHGGE